MSDQLALLPAYLTGHLQITLLALLLAVSISLPLGIGATRNPAFEKLLLGAASAIQTIPGLALLAVMVPLLAALHLPSIGFLPAIVGLTLYALLPILRNTATGIDNLDPALIEAARGVGMTQRQQLLRVELPLAMPVIVAGIRTATVWTVGMATLATPVGAVSLGNYIFSGLQTRNLSAVLVGSLAAAALALLLDAVVRMLEIGVRERRRALTASALTVAALLYGYAGAASLSAPRQSVVIGAKPFTEQLVLGEILLGWIQRHTAVAAEVLPALGSTVVFDAVRSGQVHIYVDYSGTLWTTILRRQDVPAGREDMLAGIKESLERDHGVVVAASLGFENAYVLAMRESEAKSRGIERIADLAAPSPGMSIGGDYEFFARPEWKALQARYALRFGEQRTMDPSLLYPAAARGDIDVVSAYSTDGRLSANKLRVLEDDAHVIPPYDALVLVNAAFAASHPEIMSLLSRLEGAVSVKTMRRLNLAVDANGYSPQTVAGHFIDTLRKDGAAGAGEAK